MTANYELIDKAINAAYDRAISRGDTEQGYSADDMKFAIEYAISIIQSNLDAQKQLEVSNKDNELVKQIEDIILKGLIIESKYDIISTYGIEDVARQIAALQNQQPSVNTELLEALKAAECAIEPSITLQIVQQAIINAESSKPDPRDAIIQKLKEGLSFCISELEAWETNWYKDDLPEGIANQYLSAKQTLAEVEQMEKQS